MEISNYRSLLVRSVFLGISLFLTVKNVSCWFPWVFWIKRQLCSQAIYVDRHTDQKQTRLLLNDPTVLANQLLRLESVVGSMNQTVNQLMASIQQLTHENQKQAAELTSLRSAYPAFYANLKLSQVITNSQILKFDNVLTNVGGCYDTITGVFIASRQGTYHFTSVLYTNGIDDIHAQINKNNQLLVKGFTTQTSGADTSTMNVIVSLVKGDHVYVQHRDGDHDGVRGDLHSSFSGFMISE